MKKPSFPMPKIKGIAKPTVKAPTAPKKPALGVKSNGKSAGFSYPGVHQQTHATEE
jgi:hypothetical protein